MTTNTKTNADEEKNKEDDDDDKEFIRSLLIQCAAVGRSTVNPPSMLGQRLPKGHPKTSRSAIEDPKGYQRAPNGDPKVC